MSDEINDSYWSGIKYGFTHAIPVLRDELVHLTAAAWSRRPKRRLTEVGELSLKPC